MNKFEVRSGRRVNCDLGTGNYGKPSTLWGSYDSLRQAQLRAKSFSNVSIWFGDQCYMLDWSQEREAGITGAETVEELKVKLEERKRI